MFFYLALILWVATLLSAYWQGSVKLAGFSLISGIIVIYFAYFRGLGAIGQSLLCELAVIVYLGEKLLNIKTQ